MPRLKYMRLSALTTLQDEVPNTLPLYEKKTPFVDGFFGKSNYALESKLEISSHLKLEEPRGKQDLRDFENTRIIYEAFKHLTPLQASDARLWTYLTHVTFWEHMRRRWPVEEKKPEEQINYVKAHYFVETQASRMLIRNGLANLWWYGYLTYDSDREDPYALTRVLLSKLDVASSLLERTLGRNRNVLHACLEVVMEHPDIAKRDLIRALVRELNFYGGVSILDHLAKAEIKDLATKRFEILAAKLSATSRTGV